MSISITTPEVYTPPCGINNEFQQDSDGVWIIQNHENFNYSEGMHAENYLRIAIQSTNDLSSTSRELESWIKDWSSQYHLSSLRSHLLRGFDFERSMKVLEVGCGCGAITRYLGETFDGVIAVEGSISRAKLARLRTRDLDNVTVICSPFQELKFETKFDVIFCVGVLEYSASFVDAKDPYDAVLAWFSDLLNPTGIAVIAIENQFGLKYFSSSTEDHTNTMFEGIEGYPRFGKRVRTFGYHELKARLSKHFNRLDMYFPYPDYKMPTCVLTERFYQRAQAGELISRIKSTSPGGITKTLFDERLALIELEKNSQLPFFANSFLAIAGKHESHTLKFNGLGTMYTSGRVSEFNTITRIVEDQNKSLWSYKTLANGSSFTQRGSLKLKSVKNRWEHGESLHITMLRRALDRFSTFEEIFSPCIIWIDHIKALSTTQNGKLWIDGCYLDCTWSNSFIRNDKCNFIDLEWEWIKPLEVNVLVIRALYYFLKELSGLKGLHNDLKVDNLEHLITRISRGLGIELSKADFETFLTIESEYQSLVFGIDKQKMILKLRVFLKSQLISHSLLKIKAHTKSAVAKGKSLTRLLKRN